MMRGKDVEGGGGRRGRRGEEGGDGVAECVTPVARGPARLPCAALGGSGGGLGSLATPPPLSQAAR